jgi:DNA-binding CsgD family transcriptional regulator
MFNYRIENHRIDAAALRREWLGLFTLTAWYFSVYQNYDPTLYARSMNMFWFSVALAVPMIVQCFVCSDNIAAVSRIARRSAPIGLVCTALMPLLPARCFVALFIVSPIFISPLILRCCYGVVQAARETFRLTAFMSAITAAIFAHMLWLLSVQTFGLPPFVHFLFPAAAGFVSYCIVIPRKPPVFELRAREGSSLFLQPKYLFFAATVFILIFVFDLTSDLFHYYFLSEGLRNNMLLFVGGVFLPAASLTVYAALTDRRFEKRTMIIGFSLYLLGLILALLRQGEPDLVWPLVVADGIGGAYADFFVVGFSIIFFAQSGKPVLMSSLGLAMDILTASFLWLADGRMPASFTDGALSAGHISFMAALVILLLSTALLTFDRRNEKTFVASLLGFLKGTGETDPQDIVSALSDAAMKSPEAEAAGLSLVEQTIAALFIDGLTGHDIARKLHISAGDVEGHRKIILGKIKSVAEPGNEADALAEKAVRLYGVRRRQAQILYGVLQNMTNAEIAEIYKITERTVKYHMAELFAKTGTKNRRELAARLREDG